MGIVEASPRIKRVQRTALTLLVVSGVVNYIDRATLAVANPLIRRDLGLSVADMGLLLSAFLWAYALAQLPAGAFVDRLGARRMLPLSLGLWSLAQILGGLVGSFAQFVGARVLLGLGEAPQFPTSARVVRDWFNERARGFATGIWNCSSTLGTAISAPVLTFLMLTFSWRWMFVIMGIVGLLVALTFYVVHRDPREVDLDADERAYLEDAEGPAQPQPVTWEDWRRLFAFRTTWGMILGFMGAIYILWIYSAWLPSYLEMERHISIAATGWIAAIPYVFGVVGSILGGRLCDLLVERGVSVMNSRKYPMAAALIGTADLHRAHRDHAQQRPGRGLHLDLAVLDLRRDECGLGDGAGGGTGELHGLDRGDAELRRLFRRCARPHRDRLHRPVDAVLQAGALRRRRRRPGRRHPLPRHGPGRDPAAAALGARARGLRALSAAGVVVA